MPGNLKWGQSVKDARKVQNRLFIVPLRFEKHDLCEKYSFQAISSYIIFVLLDKTFKMRYRLSM